MQSYLFSIVFLIFILLVELLEGLFGSFIFEFEPLFSDDHAQV